mgnify:FL=1
MIWPDSKKLGIWFTTQQFSQPEAKFLDRFDNFADGVKVSIV